MMLFGKRLREVRMNNKLTQQKTADLLGVALNTYQKYEQAEREPSFECLVKIADIFDVSIDYLLCRDSFITSHAISSDEH